MFAKRNKFDFVIEVLSLACMCTVLVFLIVEWNNLPEVIPGHYNATGQIDKMTDKSSLIGLHAIGWLLYGLLSAVGCFPQLWNTGGITITEDNKEFMYSSLKHMIVTLKLVLVLIFSYLTLYSMTGDNLPTLFLPITMFATFGNIAFWTIKMYIKNRTLKNK